jgi:RHS repeat-associated protein
VKAKLRGSASETDFVTGISYNPKGQRERIRYGNGSTTKYEYDMNNFRLTNILTTRSNGSDTLQDLEYEYDEMGNITKIKDKAQEVVFFNNQQVNPTQTFEYDALYRLTKATGREHTDNVADMETLFEGNPNIRESVPQDSSALRNYMREWKYDEVGNIMKMIHNANNSNWNRSYNYATGNNRLLSTKVSNSTVNYTYNEHGSMQSMPHLQNMEWNFAEQLSHITKGDTEAYYNYDGSGQRTRKVVEKNGIVETRLYLSGFEIYRKKNGNNLVLERETLHIMDDTKRIALVETLTADNGVQIANPTLVQRYQLSNNIVESATLELDETASIISYEEYYPYGDTSYQAGKNENEVSQKRYRYTGKEKDEESGLYYMLARYYSGWLGRWTAVDPAGLVDGVNLYAYCRGNPVIFLDRDGRQASSEPHYGSRKDAMKNFNKKSNHKPIKDSDGKFHGVRNEDYGITNEGKTRGLNYAQPFAKYTAPCKSEIIKDEQGKITGAKYEAEVTFKIKLEYNEIFYPRLGDKSPDKEHSVTKEQSEAIYLHEIGHQLDAKNAFLKFDARDVVSQDDAWSFISQKINYAKGEITVVTKLERTFYGENFKDIKKEAESWIGSTSKSLGKEFENKINKSIDEKSKKYHDDYGSGGNPWDGRTE